MEHRVGPQPHGVSASGVLRQHYESDALDASTLLAALTGFLPGSDERMQATVEAVASGLTENGFVLRYRTEQSPGQATPASPASSPAPAHASSTRQVG